MQTFLQDFRYSLRQLIKNPGFALTAVLSLALGIGATVSVFSVIYGVLMHPFPYADVERIGNLSIRDSKGNIFDAFFTGPQLRELRKVHAFENLATWRLTNLTMTGRGDPGKCLRLLRNRRDISYAGGSGIARPQSGSIRFPGRTGTAAGCGVALPLLAAALPWRPGDYRKDAGTGAQEVHHRRRHATELHGRLGHGCVSARRDRQHSICRGDGEAASRRKLGRRGRRIDTLAGTFRARATGQFSAEYSK